MSLFVTEPNVLPCSPALRRNTSVVSDRRFASSSASAWARSCFARLASRARASTLSSPAVASMARPRGSRKFWAYPSATSLTSPGRPSPATSRFRMTRMSPLVAGLSGLRERAVLLALSELHLPCEDRRGDGDDAHDGQRADDREQRLDDVEYTAARLPVAHAPSPSRSRDKIRSNVARSSLARPDSAP